VGAQGPPTRAASSLVRALRGARGPLLCTTWTIRPSTNDGLQGGQYWTPIWGQLCAPIDNNQVAKAIAYSFNTWAALVRFLDDGRLCMTNNAAERALRCIAVGRNNWTFAGSDNGGRRAAAIYTLIESAKLNDIDPQAWLADVLTRLQDHPARRIAELLPWNWKLLPQQQQRAAA
jgi:hypothetical protein